MFEIAREMPCHACDGTGRAGPKGQCGVCGGSGRLVGNISTEEMKKRSRVRAHHVIPMWYQKRFANDGGKLFWCSKVEGQVREAAPKRLFVKKDAYQVRDKGTGATLADCEQELAILDARGNKTVADILDRIANAERKGRLTIDIEREPLEVLASNLLVRNPELFSGSIDRVSAREKLSADESRHRSIERSTRVAMTNVVLGMSQTPLNFLRNTRIGIGRTPLKEHLIIGNHLMPNLTINRCRLFGLPIDSTTIVLWEHDPQDSRCPWRIPRIENQSPIVELSRFNARAFNRGVLEGSRIVAGSSRRTIETLVAAYRGRPHSSPK